MCIVLIIICNWLLIGLYHHWNEDLIDIFLIEKSASIQSLKPAKP